MEILREKIAELVSLDIATQGKELSLENKLHLITLQKTCVGLMTQVVAFKQGNFSALEGFSELFSAYGKVGARIRKGLVAEFSTLVFIESVASMEAGLVPAKKSMEEKVDIYAWPTVIKAKTATDGKLVIILSRKEMEAHVAASQQALRDQREKMQAAGTWHKNSEAGFPDELQRREKPLQDWDQMDAKRRVGWGMAYILMPWDLTKRSDFERYEELQAEFEKAFRR
jgi:hypothetical protein